MSPPPLSRAGAAARAAAMLATGLSALVLAPPVSVAVVGWFALAPWLAGSIDGPWRRRFGWGLLAGTTFELATRWSLVPTLTDFAHLPSPVAALTITLFCGYIGLRYALASVLAGAFRTRWGGAWPFLLATVWVALEWAQPDIFLFRQGSFQYRQPWVWQLASVAGPYGLSWLLLAVNGVLAEVWLRRREGRPLPVRPVAIVLALSVATLGFGAWRHASVVPQVEAARRVRIGFAQLRARAPSAGLDALAALVAVSRDVVDARPDLLVWGEGVFEQSPYDEPLHGNLRSLAREGGVPMLLGTGTTQADPAAPGKRRTWNSAYLLGADGEVVTRYDKMTLLAFGETVPAWLGPLRSVVPAVGNLAAGDEPRRFELPGFSFTVPICYEVTLPDAVDRLALGDIFVTITNDAWFGRTNATHLHAMLAAAAAIEHGRSLVRVAYTGSSMLVTADGAIVGETAPFTDAGGVFEVPITAVATGWAAGGRHFPHACAAIAGVLLVLVARPRRAGGVVSPALPE